MAALDPREPIETDPLDEDDVPVYLPGTPTLGFTRYIELFLDEYLR